MMSCMQIPETVLEKIRSILINFWWGAEEGKRKTHWIRQDILYKDKSLGGLGLRNMHFFNNAMLAKQGLRILQNPDSLLPIVLKAKRNPSYVWRIIFSALGILRQGVTFDIIKNTYIWKCSTDEIFTTRSAYIYIQQIHSQSCSHCEPSSLKHIHKFWNSLWKLQIPQKVKLFTWKSFHNGLPVGSEMQIRIGAHDIHCRFCNYKTESTIHIFKDCLWFSAFWLASDLSKNHLSHTFSSFTDWVFLSIIETKFR